MRFDTAMIAVPTAGTVEEAVAYALCLLRPDARVLLLADPSAHTGASAAQMADAIVALDARTEAVRAGLRERGVEVVDAMDAAEVVILPEGAPHEAIASVLAAGRPVALLSCPMPPVRALGVVAWNDTRRVRPIAELLSAHLSGAALHLISIRGAFTPDGLKGALGLIGAPETHALQAGYFDALDKLRAFLATTPIELLAVMASPGLWLRPLLEVTSGLAAGRLLVPGDDPLVEFQRRLELFAGIGGGDRIVLNAVSVDAAGNAWVADDQAFVAFAGGETLGPVQVRSGQVTVPPTAHLAIGLATDAAHAALTMEALAPVLRREGPPIVLVSVDAVAEDVRVLRGPDRRVWAVAVGPCSPLAVRAATGADAVVHAGAILEDGGPRDLPALALPVSFARAVRQLRTLGFPIAVTLTAKGGPVYPEPQPALEIGLGRLLAQRCGAVASSVAGLTWELDNREARQHIVALVAGARRRVHLQSYIFVDDATGRAVADALREAAGRGVEVRVLVDSLWSRHGSLTMESRVLVELLGAPGVELHAFRPVAEMADLKLRNHRKMVLVDGESAILPGRNFSDPYYTGFDEVAVSPSTPQNLVPWLDLSAAFTGPAVAELERLFAEAWAESGGAPYDAAPPAAAEGDVPVWLVAHRSLEDGATLDAFRLLFDHARERITLINTFPLQHELQHALIERLRAGVAVRFLTGHVRPRFRGGLEPFPGSPARDLMTELVHGRLDPLARAGADVYSVGLPERPDWDPALGRVLPHVHTKYVGIDGALCAVGSANLDVSSAYWESEVMLIVRDAERVGALERWVDELLLTSARFDPADPAWQVKVTQRAWISQNWPGLLT